MKSGYCIGVDLGGTNIAVGLVNLATREIVKQHSVKTNAPRPCEEICKDINEVCKKLVSMHRITMNDVLWVGVATPGIVKDGVVIAAFNLGWENAPFARLIREATGRPAYIANDANAAAYAEAVWGSGAGANTLVAFTLGTGVGGGIVMGGKIFEGMNGFAAEMGHMVLDPEGVACACGKRGCIEAYCSATALIRETKRIMTLYPESSMWELVCGDIDRVSGKTPFRAWESGDRAASIVVNSFIDYLAVGVSNVINILQPDVVCIGGGISREGEVLLAPLRERVLHSSFGIDGLRTNLVAATFRNDAGIIGAALLGLQNA
jgi:glucokinase